MNFLSLSLSLSIRHRARPRDRPDQTRPADQQTRNKHQSSSTPTHPSVCPSTLHPSIHPSVSRSTDSTTRTISPPPNPIQSNPHNAATYLNEANIRRLLPEALTTNIEAILPDQPGLMRTHAAAAGCQLSLLFLLLSCGSFLPGATAFAVGARTRVPDCFVRHGCGCAVVCFS